MPPLNYGKYLHLLCGVPDRYKSQISRALYQVYSESKLKCSDVKDCETITTLSDFTVTGSEVCITYTNETGVPVERCFTLPESEGGEVLRFGIEDITGVQNRAIDMQDFSFTMNNASSITLETDSTQTDLQQFLLDSTGYSQLYTNGLYIEANNTDDYTFFNFGPKYLDYETESIDNGAQFRLNADVDNAANRVNFSIVENAQLSANLQTYLYMNAGAATEIRVRSQKGLTLDSKDFGYFNVDGDTYDASLSMYPEDFAGPYVDVSLGSGVGDRHLLTLGQISRGLIIGKTINSYGALLGTSHNIVLFGGHDTYKAFFNVDNPENQEEGSILILNGDEVDDRDNGRVRWSRATPLWKKFIVEYDEITGGSPIEVNIYVLPIKGIIHAVQIVPTTTFSGGTTASATVSVGVTGNLTKYKGNTDVFTGATLTQPTDTVGIESVSGTTNIKANFIFTGSGFTQGSVDIYLLVSVLP